MTRLFLAFGLAALFLAGGVATQAADEEKLVPANLSQLMDQRGNRWDLTPFGVVSDGTNDCFDDGGVLQVNGNQIAFSQSLMTPDSGEFVFRGRATGLNITRRVRLLPELGALRYVEILQAPGKNARQVRLSIRTTLGSNSPSVMTLRDKPFLGTLEKEDGGFVAMGSNNRPGVIFLVADPHSKLKPVVQINGNRTFEVIYTLEVPAGAPVAVVHYLAQRAGGSSSEGRDLLAAVAKKGRLVEKTLPEPIRKAIVNFTAVPSRAEEEEEALPPLLAPLQELLAPAEMVRGPLDAVQIDAGSKLSGTVTGQDFTIETAFGSAPVTLAQVAAVAGGAGVGRPVRVFLRNGEILSGVARGASFLMQTEGGLRLPVDLGQIRLLVLRVGEHDGAAPEGAVLLVTTQVGDRLAVQENGTAPLEVTTPWGVAHLPLAQVLGMTTVREPFPATRWTLVDRSRFMAMLRGKEWTTSSLRFGPLAMVPQSIRELQRLEAKPTREQEEPSENKPGPAYCELMGEGRLVGTIDLETLHLVAEASTTPLASAQIVQMELEAQENGTRLATVKLADGQELRGQLQENVLPIRQGERVWKVPVAHLVAFRAPLPAAKKEAAQAEGGPHVAGTPEAPGTR